MESQLSRRPKVEDTDLICRKNTRISDENNYWKKFDEFAESYNELITDMGMSNIKLLNKTLKCYYESKIMCMLYEARRS